MNTVFIIVADKCNLKCIHCCWERTLIDDPNNMSFSNIERIIPSLKRKGYDDINLTGGEPLLMPFSLDIIEYAYSQGFSTSMCTNGLFIDKTTADRLYKAGIDYLSISLNSLDPKVNNTMRGGFKQVMNAIQIAKESGLRSIHLAVTISKKNIKDIIDIGEFALKNDIYVEFSALHVPRDSPDYEEWSLLSLDIIERKKILTEIDVICHKTNNILFLKIFKEFYCSIPPKKPSQCFACNKVFKNIVIDHNGDVYPCFYRKDLNAGNIFIDDPDKVLDKVDILRKEVKGAKCFGDHCIGLHIG